MTTCFSANLNKIALLRNTRDHGIPSLERAARTCIAAGADGITVHPRPDRRHTTPEDVRLLRALTRELKTEFNVEGYPDEAFLRLIEEVRPEQCTLVPDAPGQRTSDHGWDVVREGALLRTVVARIAATGVRVSLFVDPKPEDMAAAAASGAQRIELYTEPYARAATGPGRASSLAEYAATAVAARRAGLGVNAGHDLSLLNLAPFLLAVPEVAEVSIGHALIADALDLGLAEAVRRYVALCRAG